MFDFTKPGVGISKDAPKKEGIHLFIDILYREFWTIFTINFLFIISTIPIITIGPSICALNYVCAKLIRDEPIDVFYDYKRGFMLNFWQGTFASLINLVIFGFLGISYWFASILFVRFSYVIIFVIILFCAVNVYVFPLVSCIKLPLKAVYKNSISLAIICLKPTLSVLVIMGVLNAGLLWFISNTYFFYAFVGFGFLVYLNLFFAYPQIDKFVSIAKPKRLIEEPATFKDS
ncbi:MAG: DUF624 domain-containing protein [Clostridia bacterium]